MHGLRAREMLPDILPAGCEPQPRLNDVLKVSRRLEHSNLKTTLEKTRVMNDSLTSNETVTDQSERRLRRI